MAPADLDQGREAPSAEHGRLTPQAVISSLSQMEARAAKASDETLTSAVTTVGPWRSGRSWPVGCTNSRASMSDWP